MARRAHPFKSRRLPPGFSFASAGCSLDLEQYFWASGHILVVGIDEAGRGPLAGSVVAAAAQLPPDFRHAKLTDSKKLSARHREDIYRELQSMDNVHLAFAMASVEEIDRMNILRATHLAMRRAVEHLGLLQPPENCLIDGLAVPDFPYPQTPVVGGDALCLSIAAASIVAKVERDRTMEKAEQDYPGYGFAAHKGYGTATHLAALHKLGPCPLHRRSFKPVKQMVQQLELKLEW